MSADRMILLQHYDIDKLMTAELLANLNEKRLTVELPPFPYSPCEEWFIVIIYT